MWPARAFYAAHDAFWVFWINWHLGYLAYSPVLGRWKN